MIKGLTKVNVEIGLTITSTYDAFGQLVYPDSVDFTVNHRYNEFGYLTRISTSGYTLLECDNINAPGKITEYSQERCFLRDQL